MNNSYYVSIYKKITCKLLCFAVIAGDSWNKSSNFAQVVVLKDRLTAAPAKKAKAKAPVRQRQVRVGKSSYIVLILYKKNFFASKSVLIFSHIISLIILLYSCKFYELQNIVTVLNQFI